MNPLYLIKWVQFVAKKMAKATVPIPGYIPPPPKPPIEILRNVTLPAVNVTPPAAVVTKDKFNPKSFGKPVLWPYNPVKSGKIWYAYNYQDYIIPDNELVKHFVDNITVQWHTFDNGYKVVVRYKDTLEPIGFKYRIDDARLCDESGQDYKSCYENYDFWMPPDYYIWNEFEGDCDDYALLLCSVFENLGIPYMFVMGYMMTGIGSVAHCWVEFMYDSRPQMIQVNIWGGSTAVGISDGHNILFTGFTPRRMFNKTTKMSEYTKWWE